MKKRYLISGLLLLAISGAAFLHWTELVVWVDAHPNMASWVQAFGSIGAIWIAAWSVSRTHELQTQQKNIEAFDENTRTLEAVFHLVGGAAQVAGKIFDLENSGGPATPGELVMTGIELDAFADAIHRLDPSRLDRYDFIEAALVADMTLRHLKDAVDRVQSKTFSRALEPHYLQNVANMAQKALGERAKKLARVIENRGLRKISDTRPS